MDYDWLPWIFMEGVIIRVACLNVKRIEHQGEQKSCLKTSSHCKKRNQVSYIRWRCTTLRTPWRRAHSSDISPGSAVNNLKHKISVTYPQKKGSVKLNIKNSFQSWSKIWFWRYTKASKTWYERHRRCLYSYVIQNTFSNQEKVGSGNWFLMLRYAYELCQKTGCLGLHLFPRTRG